MLVRPARCCHSQSIHSAARGSFSGSRGSRAQTRTLASTKHGAVIGFFSLWVGLRWPGKRESLARAPRAVGRVVDVAVAQLAAQYFADIAGETHAALCRVHLRLRGGLVVQGDRDVSHNYTI